MRELGTVEYNKTQFVDENMLLAFKLMNAPMLDKTLTTYYGQSTNAFPLLSMLQSNDTVTGMKPLNGGDTQYKWKVRSRMEYTSKIVGLVNTAVTKPGQGYRPFEILMEDDRFIPQWTAVSPDGLSTIRIQSEGEPVAVNRYRYEVVLNSSSPDAFVDLANFTEGKYWTLSAPIVAASKSDGNRSHDQGFTDMTNQYGFFRFSKKIAGNVANKVVNIELPLEGGGTTNLWMPYSMKLWEIERKKMLEDQLWTSEYNRDAYGKINLKDKETGEPIPTGAGVFQQIKVVGNTDTYGTRLTLRKLDNTLIAIHSNRDDSMEGKEIICYTGSGGARMFHRAITEDPQASKYYQTVGDLSITASADGLMYGAYYNRYKTIDGMTITVKVSDFFDKGNIASMQRKNGDMYDGFPLFSYTLAFLDHSLTEQGERNISFVCEEGREIISGVFEGLTPLPAEWRGAGNVEGQIKRLATTKDMASYEVMQSMGLAFKNPSTSFILSMSR